MKVCDIDHLHKRFLDIWEWCMRQGFDTRAFTYVENAFKSEPTAELVDRKTEPTTQTKTQNSNLSFEKADEPQTYVINPQEPTNEDKCFECDDFFTCGGQCNKIEDEPHTEEHCNTCRHKDEC